MRLPVLGYALVRLAAVIALVMLSCACSRTVGDLCSESERCGEGLACLGDRCARCGTSDACKLRGQCAAADGRCAVKADADDACSQPHGSEGYTPCSQGGFCQAREGVCAASAEGCKAARMCKSAGACSLDQGRCMAKTADDCKAASVCLEAGQCTPEKGVCSRTSDEDCAKAKPCMVFGKCSLDKSACVVLKDADCAKSALCKAHGQCTAKKGKCIGDKADKRDKRDKKLRPPTP